MNPSVQEAVVVVVTLLSVLVLLLCAGRGATSSRPWPAPHCQHPVPLSDQPRCPTPVPTP